MFAFLMQRAPPAAHHAKTFPAPQPQSQAGPLFFGIRTLVGHFQIAGLFRPDFANHPLPTASCAHIESSSKKTFEGHH